MEQETRFCSVTHHIAIPMQAQTESTHSNEWSQWSTMPECSITTGDGLNEKKWWNGITRVICDSTHGIDARRGVWHHRGFPAGSDRAHPLWKRDRSWMEFLFADFLANADSLLPAKPNSLIPASPDPLVPEMPHLLDSLCLTCVQPIKIHNSHQTQFHHNRHSEIHWYKECQSRNHKPCQIHRMHLMLAISAGTLTAVRLRTTQTGRFGSSPIQVPEQLPFGRPNPKPYPSTNGLCRVLLDQSVPISSFVIRVSLFIVAFRYATVQRKILTFVRTCQLWMDWLPWWTKQTETHALPYPEDEHHWSVNDCCSCMLGNLEDDRFHVVRNIILAAVLDNRKARRSLHLLENVRESSINHFCSSFFRTICGTWLQASINNDTAAGLDRYVWDISTASSQTVTTYFSEWATTKCSWLFWPTTLAKTTYIDNTDYIALWSTMMQGEQSLTFCWCLFSRWGREHVTLSFSNTRSQYVVYDCLQPVATYITQETWPMIVDAPVTLIFKMMQGGYCNPFSQ